MRLTHLACLILATSSFQLVGQSAAEFSVRETRGLPLPAQHHPADLAPELPMPPRGIAPPLPKHALPELPVGIPRPGPNTQPSAASVVAPSGGSGLVFYQNRAVAPGAALRGTIGEPSVAVARDTALQTGNWYAARSLDNGSSWQHINPATTFPALDGGFCCDQRVYAVDSPDVVVWLLQYDYSSSTATGSYRIAIANGRTDLRSGPSGSWHSYVFTPQLFGFRVGHWLDFPDLARGGDQLYASANVYDANGAYQGSVAWRMDLADLAAAATLDWGFVTSATLGGISYRFAARPASDDRIYMAAFRSTTELYVYRYGNDGTVHRAVRPTGSWNNVPATCPGPDGRDWCGGAVGRIRGSFSTPAEIGFMWTCASSGVARPNPYTRVIRLTADENRAVVAEHDLWSTSVAIAYATGRGNAQGEVGLVAAIGGRTTHVHSEATLIDAHQSWGPLGFIPMNSGTHGSSVNRWGDYFDVHVHPLHQRTFVATGMSQNGSAAQTSSEHRFAWFGRAEHEPTWVRLAVEATGVPASVPIDCTTTDLDGLASGSSNYLRRFAPRQAYQLTASPSRFVGTTEYVFERWALRSSPTAAFTLQPLGEPVLVVDDIGTLDDTAQARYLAKRTLTIRSTNPPSGVSITVTPTDLAGATNGVTQLLRSYRHGTQVTLAAPAQSGTSTFSRWVVAGVPQPTGQLSATVAADADLIVTAEYRSLIAGSWQTIGGGCAGSNGRVPVQSLSQTGNLYLQGQPLAWLASDAPVSTSGTLQLGLSDRSWAGQRLPLDLGAFGGAGCWLHHDLVVALPAAATAMGTARTVLTFPIDPATVGTAVFSTYFFLDPRLPRGLPLAQSNAVAWLQGGHR